MCARRSAKAPPPRGQLQPEKPASVTATTRKANGFPRALLTLRYRSHFRYINGRFVTFLGFDLTKSCSRIFSPKKVCREVSIRSENRGVFPGRVRCCLCVSIERCCGNIFLYCDWDDVAIFMIWMFSGLLRFDCFVRFFFVVFMNCDF